MKLTIEQLKNYLGTGLKIEHAHREFKLIASFDGVKSSEEVIEFVGHDEKFEGRCILIKINNSSDAIKLSETYPICYRLSDLDKFIPELGFVPIEIICDEIYNKQPLGFIHPQDATSWFDAMYLMEGNTDDMSFWMFQKLFQWHFWPFGDEYFENGLVIDKLKLTEK